MAEQLLGWVALAVFTALACVLDLMRRELREWRRELRDWRHELPDSRTRKVGE